MLGNRFKAPIFAVHYIYLTTGQIDQIPLAARIFAVVDVWDALRCALIGLIRIPCFQNHSPRYLLKKTSMAP